VVGKGEPKEKRLGYPVKKAIFANAHIAVLPAAENARVEIFDAETLDRVKTLLSTEPLIDISSVDGKLMLHGNAVIDVYSLETFARVRTIGSTANGASSPGSAGLKDGLLARGILYNSSGKKPKLLVAPNEFLSIKGADTRLYSGSFLRRETSEPINTGNRRRNQSGAAIVAGPITVPSRAATLSLEESRTAVRRAGSTSSSITRFRVTLIVHDADGTLRLRVPILNETTPALPGRSPDPSKLLVADDVAVVVVEDRIFRWSLTGIAKPETTEIDVEEFHVEPRQSDFLIDGPMQELKHTVKGGRTPYEFFLLTRLDGVEMNDKTGIVTVTREKLMNEAAVTIQKAAADRSDVGAAVQKLKSQSLDVMKPAMTLAGRKVDGLPIAVPIHFKVIDDDGNVAEMQYFVLLVVPYRSLTEMLRESSDQLDND
jgi:hypothetical protein